MTTLPPSKRALEAFDTCSGRTVTKKPEDAWSVFGLRKAAPEADIVVTCPKYPRGDQYVTSKDIEQWPARTTLALRLGCLGCEFSRDNRVEKILVDELHPEIIKGCSELFLAGHYPEAAVNGNKTVKERLRGLTGFESGSEAIGKGGLYFPTSVAEHVDGMHQQAVANTLRAIDSFRNEISHTAPDVLSAQITRDVSYWHLGQSSLAMHYLDTAEIRPR